MDLDIIDKFKDKLNQHVGSDSVTVAKGVFSAEVRASKMCKNHPELNTIQGSVQQFYDDCFSNGKTEETSRVLTEYGVFTLTWKCDWYTFTNEIHTTVSHRALTAEEAAYFSSIKEGKEKLGF